MENYSVGKINYDRNGNILSLWRHGLVLDAQGQPRDIDIMDKLSYLYGPLSNQLEAVADESGYLEGFRDKVNAYDYDYDSNGNMKFDKNKGISKIYYNHLNLPTDVVISEDETGTISYIYDATGAKLRKVVDNTTASSVTTTDYAGNFIYENNVLKFFSHPEGYVEPTTNGNFDYIYQYKDHLGNIRLSYRDVSTTSTPLIEIVEENNYYPFGLRHKGYNSVQLADHPYKYNGKELNEEMGLDWYDYGARFFEPTTGRWFSVDAFAEKYYSQSPYEYALNNPVLYVDPDGNQVEMCCDGLKGFLARSVDNVFGTDFTEKFDTGTTEYRNGVNTSNGASLAVSTIMIIDGTTSATIGGTGLAVSGTATLATGGTATPVTAITGTASGGLLVKGLMETAVGGIIMHNTINNMKDDANSSGSSNSSSSSRTSNDSLRRDKNGNAQPDPEAEGTSHTQLGTKEGRNGNYKQGREFDSNNNPVRDVDFTDHGRPNQHTNPHQNRYKENQTGGTRQRGKAEPIEDN